jgi:hypothetical protein
MMNTEAAAGAEDCAKKNKDFAGRGREGERQKSTPSKVCVVYTLKKKKKKKIVVVVV